MKCSKCHNPMEEQPMSPDLTDGQESEYYAGNQHLWVCPVCLNHEYINDCPCMEENMEEVE